MSDEEVIRSEASTFVETHLSRYIVEGKYREFVDSIRSELKNFYSPEAKVIFLDQLIKDTERLKADSANSLFIQLTAEGRNATKGNVYEKIIFYIRQEISILPQIITSNKVDSKGVERSKVFISYSHVDKEWLEKFRRHFKPFEDQIDFWDDSKIKPGNMWKEEIENAIKETKVAVLLISADFFASEFIAKNELPPLLKAAQEDGATILSVILKPVYFEGYESVNQYQTINSPTNPVISMNEENQELIWVELVKTIREILES